MAERNTLFTGQPSCIYFKSAGTFNGDANTGTLTYDKENGCFVQDLTVGAQITHNKIYEIINLEALTGDIIINSFLLGSTALGDLKPLVTVTAGSMVALNLTFSANQIVAFTSAVGPTEFRVLVREYNAVY